MHQTRLVAAKGLVYSMTVALVTLVSATTLISQEPQHPQNKPDTQQPDTPQQVNKAVVVTGTIVKSGSDFVLKDTSGTVYKLDAPEKAEPFEGKSVKVTGQLDSANATLIHVDAIEAMSA
jgi:DNA/RNA endonuclease YhcR with UshA esterase domain